MGTYTYIQGAILLLTFSLSCRAVAQDCCNQAECQQAASAYAQAIQQQLSILGSCPVNAADQQDKVERLCQGDCKTELDRLFREIRRWVRPDEDGSMKRCINDHILELELDAFQKDNLLRWKLFFENQLDDQRWRSSEFCKGVGIHLEIDQGGKNIFGDEESFLLLGRGYLSYTFGSSDFQCGGRFRLMVGGGFQYQDTKAFGYTGGRAEYRIVDLGDPLTSIGHLKLITEAGHVFGVNTFQALGGAGIDLANFQFQLMGGWQERENNYLFVGGIAYRLFN